MSRRVAPRLCRHVAALTAATMLASLLVAVHQTPAQANSPSATPTQAANPTIELVTWGANFDGELGDGTTTSEHTPQQIALPDGVAITAIAAGGQDGYALGSDGNVYAWGANNDEQLGDGTDSPADTPQLVPLPAGVTVTAISASAADAYALGSDGHVYAWGNNTDGELGDGSTKYSLTPVQVALPDGATATSIAAGEEGDAFATGSDGHLYAWGSASPLLGLGTPTGDVVTPEPVALPAGVTASEVAAGVYTTLAIGSDGTLYAWGSYLGDNDPSSVSRTPVPIALPDGAAPLGIAASESDLVIGSDGVLYAWASNDNGDLGIGFTGGLFDLPRAVELPAGVSASAVVAVGSDSAAIGSDGTLYTWGDNSFGQIGDGTTTARSVPVPITLASGVRPISVKPGGVFTMALGSPTTPTVPVAGTITDSAGAPVPGAEVVVCPADGGACVHVSTGSDGAYAASAAPASTVTINVYPAPGSKLMGSGASTWAVPETGVTGVDLVLSAPDPSALGGLSFPHSLSPSNGLPVIDAEAGTPMTLDGCPGGLGVVSVIAQDAAGPKAGDWDYAVFPMSETSAGHYSGGLPPLWPMHGPAVVSSSVTCPTAADLNGLAVHPTQGAEGTGVTLIGSGFIGATGVLFGTAESSSFAIYDDAVMQAVAPAGSGTVDVTVLSPSGAQVVGQFTYDTTIPAHTTTPAHSTAPAPAKTAAKTAAKSPASTSSTASVTPDAIDSDKLLAALKVAYQYFQSGQSVYGVLKAAYDVFLATLHPTCATIKATAGDIAGLLKTVFEGAISALVAAVTPFVEPLVFAALAPLVTPIVAAIASPFLAEAAVEYVVNYLADKMLEAALKALLAKLFCGPADDALIDPSGRVLDTSGNPIAGATTTILRADTAAGPFLAVDPTSPGIEPAVNPETTGADGGFHWDVAPGFYEVQAAAAGCTDPSDTSQNEATIGPLPVPPPQVGLTVTMACANQPPPPRPVVSNLDVDTGSPVGGTDVTITGTGFTPSASVTFGGVQAETTYLSPTVLRAVSPPEPAGIVDVVVGTAGGDSATSTADRFVVGTIAAVASLSVNTGPNAGGTRITVNGNGFTQATGVSFGGAPGTDLVVDNDSQLEITTPAALPGVVDVQVLTPAGASAPGTADQFTFQPPATTTIKITANPAGYGTSSRVTVAISTRQPATGRVTLSGAGDVQARTLSGSAVTFVLPGTLTPGTYRLTVTFSGTGTISDATASATLVIPKGAVAAVTTVVTGHAVTPQDRRALVRVSTAWGLAQAGGLVRITLTKGSTHQTVTGTLNRGWTTVALPRLGRGTWQLVASYLGDHDYLAKSGRPVRVTVN